MEKSCIYCMFRNDKNEKEQYETACKECLVLINKLQITYKCVFYILLKKLSDDKTFGQKSISDKQLSDKKLSDNRLSDSLIVRRFSVLTYAKLASLPIYTFFSR